MAIRLRVVAWLVLAMLVIPANSIAGVGDTSAGVAEPELQAPAFLGGFLKETRVIYPLQMGDWQAQGEHLYDQQQLGASVRYRHAGEKDRWIDLYFYPAGLLPESQLTQDVDATLEGIRLSAGQQGSYSEADISPVDAISFPAGSGKSKQEIPARSASLRLVRDGKAYSSAMVMLVKDMYYFKGRYSVDESVLSRRGAQQQLEKLMGQVVHQVVVRSTGDCWMAPPIITLPAPLAVGAPGQLANVQEGGSVSAVAYQDRVEALDATSPQAIVMQALAMSMTNRLFPGCVAPEDTNPFVPEGMRELRLEFHAAPGERGDQPVPLKPGRTEVT